jgi:hypothetical protein
MATRIGCIISDAKDPDNRIVGVGVAFGWAEWENQIIGEIEDGANYYVEVHNERVAVLVAERHEDGRKYLTTDPNRTTTNYLLSLPHCRET